MRKAPAVAASRLASALSCGGFGCGCDKGLRRGQVVIKLLRNASTTSAPVVVSSCLPAKALATEGYLLLDTSAGGGLRPPCKATMPPVSRCTESISNPAAAISVEIPWKVGKDSIDPPR